MTGRRMRPLAIAAVTMLLVFVLTAWWTWGRPRARAARAFAQARSAWIAGDEPRAERLARDALDLDPALGEAGLLAAQSAVAERGFQRALEHLARITAHDPRLQFRAALMSAEVLNGRLHRLGDAERAYRRALDIEPDDLTANEGLANLLALCGRSREAIPNILRIVRQEQPTDLLVLLARIDGVLHDREALEAALAADSGDPNPLVGTAWHAAQAGEVDRAIALVRQALVLAPEHPAARAALGKLLLEVRRFGELADWARQNPPTADESPEIWFVLGRAAENEGDPEAAVRCYWESLRRSPESKAANSQLSRLLNSAGQAASAERFAARVRTLQALEALQNRVLFEPASGSASPLLQLAGSYEAAGRLWEAYGWCQAAVRMQPESASALESLGALRQRVKGLPLQLTVDEANPALDVDLSSYPLPRFRKEFPSAVDSASPILAAVSFRDDARRAELVFRYDNGTDGTPAHRMFEFTGGGIAVLDFDSDGYPDVFFTQGCSWPPPVAARSSGDRLFRNNSGTAFHDISTSAGFDQGGFGQGVAVGDVDADGFSDLYAAHIGANRLWLNNGDGTFTDRTTAAGIAGHADDWTTSCILADLDGDTFPDIYAANYVTGPDVFERVCRDADGYARICMPFDFEAQPDRLWINDGRGGFTEAGPQELGAAEAGKGLGLAAWDAEGTGRMSVLVANDTTSNFFLVPGVTADGHWRLCDRGFSSGLAVDGEGKAKGCMGIALMDLNDDGRLDVHISNFLNESSTLYLSGPEGTYEDRTRETGLFSATRGLLGFGTQFLDADLDGRLELFLSSGHIDDFSRQGKPYRMPAKLFRWTSGRFIEADGGELGPYFRAAWLGRAVARLDWNRDGREDLVVGHLVDDSALLTNTTADAGNYLAMRLFGVLSNRDAIGTAVEVMAGKGRVVRQLTAGDGYQASNERRLVFGLGAAERADEVIIRWPSGTVQRFTDIPAGCELWLVEGHAPVLKSPVPPGS